MELSIYQQHFSSLQLGLQPLTLLLPLRQSLSEHLNFPFKLCEMRHFLAFIFDLLEIADDYFLILSILLMLLNCIALAFVFN
jgi:hypothetical protein